jgi:hypothetical protein
MCNQCGANLCAIFDRLVADYFRDFPAASPEEERQRPKYIPMDVRNAPDSAGDFASLTKLVEHAPEIGLPRMTFLAELSERSGFGNAIQMWMREKVPNGLVRKIILSCAEQILREHGAMPTMSMQLAA